MIPVLGLDIVERRSSLSFFLIIFKVFNVNYRVSQKNAQLCLEAYNPYNIITGWSNGLGQRNRAVVSLFLNLWYDVSKGFYATPRLSPKHYIIGLIMRQEDGKLKGKINLLIEG